MNTRSFNKRIGVYKTTVTADGYGGNTVTESYVGESWCDIRTVANSSRYVGRLTDLGINEPLDAIIINMRYRNDIDINYQTYYFVYNGYKYVIQALTNIDFQNKFMEVIAIQKGTTTT